MRNALFIDGHWVPPARGRTFPVIDPATANTIHSAPAGTTEDIDWAVEAAVEWILFGIFWNQGRVEKVLGAVEKARGEGATVIAGGDRVEELAPGYFVRPTILVDVPVASDAWREEIFGPVVSIRSFNEEAEAVRLANDSRYGLAAAVMSEDLERAERAERVGPVGLG